jgi:beta-galactosidase/beta-glucuronidase
MPENPIARASTQGGSYPRPQLVRQCWLELAGEWEFAFDDSDAGRREGWAERGLAAPRPIVVPFPPESPASGVCDPGPHRVLWYRRAVAPGEVVAAGHGAGRRLLLHFGAVDYRADVWIDGQHVAAHEGGHTPFTAEVPDPSAGFSIVVRVEDDPHDLTQPRGKQDWETPPHAVWYQRTSGIWQPVWIESVPPRHLRRLSWMPDVAGGEVRLTTELDGAPTPGTRVRVVLRHGEHVLADVGAALETRESLVVLPVPALRNGQALENLLWSPERPTLLDAVVELEAPGQEPDVAGSYLGVRSVATEGGRFLLNDRPYEMRGVLSQGYWPQSHLAAPGAHALRAEVELIKELGFTMVRVHQKIEDPRFLFWADRLGLLVWEEMPSVYEFSATASSRLLTEWTEAVRRDVSHPSVVAWVPFNESWGVQHLAADSRQRDLVRAVYHLTKSLDGSRPVISNDGWEHTRSDLLTVHDYENDATRLLDAYGGPNVVERSLDGVAPSGRRTFVGTAEESAATGRAPVILSEFGGVSIDPRGSGTWGYRHVDSARALEEHLAGLLAAVRGSRSLVGWCYTQLTDTAQETNGLVDENRVPKLPVSRIRALIEGSDPVDVESPRAPAIENGHQRTPEVASPTGAR